MPGPKLTEQEFAEIERRVEDEAIRRAPAGLDEAALERYVDGEIDKAVAAAEQAKAARERPRSFTEQLGTNLMDMARTQADVPIGALKGVANTVLSIGQLGAHFLPAESNLTDVVTGESPRDRRWNAFNRLKEQYATPTSGTQSLAFGLEQVAETVVPATKLSKLGQAMSAVSKAKTAAVAGKTVGPVAGRVAGLATRAATEAAGAGAMAAAQGGDPTIGAVIGGGLPVVGAGLRQTGRLLTPKATPTAEAAQQFAERHGVELDAALQTGSRAVQRAQNTLNYLGLPAFVAERASKARHEALRRTGGELAETVAPGGRSIGAVAKQIQKRADRVMSREQEAVGAAVGSRLGSPTSKLTGQKSGASIDRGVVQFARDQKAVADENWAGFRAEAAADSATTAATRDAPTGPIFKDPIAADGSLNKDRLWKDTWKNALLHGYKGRPKDLRDMWETRLQQAGDWLKQREQGNLGKKVLDFISRNGGLGKVDDAWQGEIDQLWENSTAARAVGRKKAGGFKKQQYKDSGAIGGITGVVKRGGLTVEHMFERMRNDPEIAGMLGLSDDAPDSELFNIIDEMANIAGKQKPVSVGEAMAEMGVRPGQVWWQDAQAGVDLGELARLGGNVDAVPAQSKALGIPADIRGLKQRVRELTDDVVDSMPAVSPDAENSVHMLRKILSLNDTVSAPELQNTIEMLNDAIRLGTASSTNRSRVAGRAAAAKVEAEKAMATALENFPQAAEYRHTAKLATRMQHWANRISEKLGRQGDDWPAEGQAVFDTLTSPKEGSLEALHRIARAVPTEMPALGRALVDDVMDTQAFGKWWSIGPEKKRVLFGSPERVKMVDQAMRRRERVVQITRGMGGRKNPEELFGDLLNPDNVRELRYLGKRMPTVGRAWLDDIFRRVDDAADNPAAQMAVLKEYTKANPEQLKILIPDKATRDELNILFPLWIRSIQGLPQIGSRYSLAKPLTGGGLASATGAGLYYAAGLGALMLTQGGALGAAALMHNPRARRALIDVGSKAGRGMSAAQWGAVAAHLNALGGGRPSPQSDVSIAGPDVEARTGTER